ncbi:DUF4112 domain-containing protein [Stieleria sp. ICT_E10.1]|uniref:DUF4112 domain-containing protein n=1 Tax=Stieleria sedimenti TaxID=2976331 RepID=UPI00217F7C94|nr:DUF4112 domain-containing protein [Stieleria sedimenti]MCS7467218.1 DUF4112 domain-containing protein [Stieleria sedimenti]
MAKRKPGVREMSQWQDVERRLARVRKFAGWMDDKFALPGTRVRFGLDTLVGLLPGVGDAATAVVGLWLIGEAFRMKASTGVLIRMCGNVLIDATLGAVPIAGDLFDWYWKSNRRNAVLLEKHLNKRVAGP